MKTFLLSIFAVLSLCVLAPSVMFAQSGTSTSSPQPELNNGRKWKANQETTTAIRNMMQLVQSHSGDNIESYRALKGKLQKELQYIFENCSMKGKAHDQLHSYIVPLRDLIKQLDQDELSELRKSNAGLEAHLSRYATIFE